MEEEEGEDDDDEGEQEAGGNRDEGGARTRKLPLPTNTEARMLFHMCFVDHNIYQDTHTTIYTN
eukprot:3085169-Pyramimonas_sp.AAC.1